MSMSKEEAERLVNEVKNACDTGIAIAGPRRALEAALVTHHKLLSAHFENIKNAYEYAHERGLPKTLPLVGEIMDAYTNAAGSMLVICELMNRGCLWDGDESNRQPSVLDVGGSQTLQ